VRREIESYQHAGLLHQSSTVIDVLRESNIVVAAVTRPIDLDAIDPHGDLDLRRRRTISILQSSSRHRLKRDRPHDTVRDTRNGGGTGTRLAGLEKWTWLNQPGPGHLNW
jgi:hypothetical protein